MTDKDKIRALLNRGVEMPAPDQVTVAPEVPPERIAPGVVLYPGTRLAGEMLSIGPGCKLGQEQPAIVNNCQLGHDVALKGGYFKGAVFLDGASMGSAAHVRPATLLEEQASGAHAVGFKQTILLAYVTTGSLINFCDVLMAGGTDRKHHSEVGSSYVHFNFTPHGDKATPSLIGDVPLGVRYDQAPIFLGGQGGLVGPARVAYGVTLAAGVIQRKDALQAGHLYTGGSGRAMAPRPYAPSRYGSINRVVTNNLIFIGNLLALQIWYRHVRSRFMRNCPFREACRLGALQVLADALKERVKRMDDLAKRVAASADRANDPDPSAAVLAEQRAFCEKWPAKREQLKKPLGPEPGAAARTAFLTDWEKSQASTHTDAMAALSAEARTAATAWLQAIVDHVTEGMR